MTIGSHERENPLERRRTLIRQMYGNMVGRRVEDVPTPAMLVDLAAAERNIARMASALGEMPAEIRPHIKVHKSAELAARQVGAGAIGLSVATVWEAVALAWAGLDNLFVVNTVAHPEKIRVLAELARDRNVLVAVDQMANAAKLSAAAAAAGSQLGVMIEVDTGMDRAGVDSENEAVALAKEVSALDHLRLEGITGYEGHCSLEFDEELLIVKQRAAMDMFLRVAERMESIGIPCPIRSAGGTVSWKLTAARPGVTEIQAGSYVLMDNFHGARVPGGFEHALTIATTVISRPPNRLIVDAGNKSIGIGGGPSLVGADLEVLRFDEEHGIFVVAPSAASDPEPELPVGAWVRLVPGYAPATVNMYDNYYVIADGQVVDVWPVFPRGPGHNGLIALP
ncbi:MAG: alanine racemase [Acidimicrobiales bacterium]|jgi:D-serine deaminase-like pyridoxal phosphate-dependent protein